MKITFAQIKKNVAISIFAQIISLGVSFIMNLIIPKFISEYQYAYWQTYLLYISYVGIFHFGLLDGIVLRYSQYDYEELDKTKIRSQFMALLIHSIFIALILGMMSIVVLEDEMQIIFLMVSIGIVIRNVYNYASYSFQLTNRINYYARMTIAYRVFYGIAICLLLLFRIHNFYWFCLMDLCSDLFAVFFTARLNKGMYFGKMTRIKEIVKEIKCNVSAGFMLMASNWSSFLLTGTARMIIQWNWSELVFGKVSFSFSITNLFLTFVNAISVVLFPSLKRTESEELPQLYEKVRNMVSPFLICIMVLYFPGCWILEKWLPAYSDGLHYLGILLPMIIFTSKVGLLTNNYLKAYREEKKMLMINIVSVIIAFVLFGVSAYCFNSLELMLICIVVVLMIRSIASEVAVMRILKLKDCSDFLFEGMMSLVFICIALRMSLMNGFFAYIIAILIYLISAKLLSRYLGR